MTKDTKIEKFKQELNCVFDDNLHTKQWHNIADWTIIGLIIISSLEIFLSTFDGVTEKYGNVLHFIDLFTTIIFTIEVSLRIWCADLLDDKYKGFWGRIRYCFSFYGLIDILSTYPFYLSLFIKLPVVALKALRVARLLRIFRYMRSFRILGEAISSKKQELAISVAFLSIITVILSFLLYFAEHSSQPDSYENGWNTLVWSFAKYLGDPGKIADFPLMTFWGHVIAAVIGLLGIAIFAVPAGLISSGFVEVIEQRNHKKEVEENLKKLHFTFERKKDRPTGYQIMPPFLSIIEIQARMKMTEDDIMESVEGSDDFRVINVASTIPVSNNPMDRLAVEHFFVNTDYGCRIDRGSKVTIVNSSGVVDPIMSHFAYYLAKMGGFNYISREIGQTRPYTSFYSIPSREETPLLEHYMSDIEQLSSIKGSWVISLLAASGANEQEFPEKIHFGYGGAKGDGTLDNADIVQDKSVLEAMMSGIETNLKKNFGIDCDRQKYHDYSKPTLYYRHLRNASDINGLAIRIAWSVSCHDYRRVAICREIALTIKSLIEPEKDIAMQEDELMLRGIGIDDYKC